MGGLGGGDAGGRGDAARPRAGHGSAYHYLTQHWVCAELVRRLDGRANEDYLRDEITGPLGMDDT